MKPSKALDGRRQPHPPAGLSETCRPIREAHLAPTWIDGVVRPRSFRVFRDDEIPAHRIIGHDGDDIPCFHAYDYRRLDVRSDDDEEFYVAVAYSESVSAWRLQDGRWLVHRRLEPLGDEDAAIHALSIDERMPR